MRRWAIRPVRYPHYRLAADWPETFYGQIALAHIEASPAAASERHWLWKPRRRPKWTAIP